MSIAIHSIGRYLSEHVERCIADGSCVVVSTKSNSGTNDVAYVKNSVDVGRFVPGVYRVNPYSADRPTFTGAEFSAASEVYVQPYTWKWSIRGSPGGYYTNEVGAAPLAEPSFEPQAALQSAYSNVNASALTSLVELGEIKETLNLLRDPFRALREFAKLNHLKRLRHEWERYNRTGIFFSYTGKRALRAATDSWMEARYGLRPLMYSIADIMKLVEERKGALNAHKYARINSVRGRCTRDMQTVGDETPWMTFSHKKLTYCAARAKLSYKGNCSASASVQFRYKDIPTMAQRLGLAPEYLPEAWWDLTRLSFMFDWWFDLGLWIRAHRPTPGIEILGNTVSLKRTTEVHANIEVMFYYDTPWRPADVGNDILIGQRESFTRDVNVDIGFPTMPLGRMMDWQQCVDTLIILYQRINKFL